MEPPTAVARGTTRDVLDLAVPAMAGGFVMMGYHWVNQFWVGRMGTAATAALSVATFGTWAMHAVTILASVGLVALVGRYSGAGREGAARYVALHGVRFALALAAVVGVLAAVLVAPLPFEQADVSPDAKRLGASYLRIAWAGSAAPAVLAACESVWRGRGNTRVPFVVSALALLVNAFVDPFFVFGAPPWEVLAAAPESLPDRGMGVAGAALATVLCNALAALASFLLLRRARFVSPERPADDELRIDDSTLLARGPYPPLDLSVARRVLAIGTPLAATGLLFVGIYLVVSRVVTRAGGDAAQAGLGVGLRGEQAAFVVGQGFAAAAAALVARRLGAGRPDLAARSAWRATILASLACLAWGLVLFLFAEPLARLFLPARDVEAVRHASEYYRIVSWCLVPQCWEVVLEGAFTGAGLTIPPTVASAAMTALRVPLAILVVDRLGWGVAGVWWVIAATAAARGIVLVLWFSRGTWRTKSV